LKIYSLDGNSDKFYYAKILNTVYPYYLDFVHISETRTKPLLIGDYCNLLGASKLNRKSVYNSTPTFSQKAFECLKDYLIPQSEEIIELNFEKYLFFVVLPRIFNFTDCLNWSLLVQELPADIHFFRDSIYATGALVTQEFKDICDKHKLKGMVFRLEYDSEATP
jgi:hypothetical protein